MKKVLFPILALVLVVGLALPMAAPAAAYTEADPDVITLYAGQDIDVGTVKVWNDDNNLYVKYETTGGWVMTETHLAVETSLEGIPQTKTGNPKVGHFEYSEPHDPPVTSYSYPPIDVSGLGDTLYIAAHAVVVNTNMMTITLVSDTDTQTAGWFNATPPVDPSLALYPTSYFPGYWYGAFDLTSPNSAWYDEDSLLEAVWISTMDGLEGLPTDDQWRLFKEDFEVPSGAVNIVGSLKMTADNALAAYLNEALVGNTSYVYGDATVPPRDISVQYFRNLQGPYDFYPEEGPNSLEFVVRNYYSPAGNNPTGLLYRAEITYCNSETAWADGTRFTDRGNWATYFTYTEPVLVDTVCVPATGGVVYSSINVETSKQYRLKAAGIADAGDTIDFDAKYSITKRISGDEWTDTVSGYESHGPQLLDLQVDGAFVDWGLYNEDHVYYWTMTGTGSPVALEIYDIYYPNNVGSLTVEIYLLP